MRTAPIPGPHATLRLVNDSVVLRRQVLRLVTVDNLESSPAPENLLPPTPGNVRRVAPTRGGLTAARVAIQPVPEFARGAGQARTTAGSVRREMLSAACLSPDDARLILAKRAGEVLQEGRLARLPPARRQALTRLATRLGLREFDASLVIAIAQDAARAGEPLDSPDVTGRLRMLGPAPRTRPAPTPWTWSLAAAAALAVVAVAALVQWIAPG